MPAPPSRYWGGLTPSGDREESHKQIETALAMFRDLAMQFWLDKAEAALKTI